MLLLSHLGYASDMGIRETNDAFQEESIETDAGVVVLPKLHEHGAVNQEEVQAALEKVSKHLDKRGLDSQPLGAVAENPDPKAQDDPYQTTWRSLINVLLIFLIIVVCVTVTMWLINRM